MTYREILDLDAAAPVVLASPRTAVYPLLGRQAEWSALLGAWHAAEAGHPRLFLIRGEAGIGKSRLAEELVDWCKLRNVGVVTARCYAGEGQLAYAPIAAWLKSNALRPVLMKLDAAIADRHRTRFEPEVIAAPPRRAAHPNPSSKTGSACDFSRRWRRRFDWPPPSSS